MSAENKLGAQQEMSRAELDERRGVLRKRRVELTDELKVIDKELGEISDKLYIPLPPKHMVREEER